MKIIWIILAYLCSMPVVAWQPIKEQQDSAKVQVDIVYPQNFRDSVLNQAIDKVIQQERKAFAQQKKDDAALAQEVPGKTSLMIRTESVFQKTVWTSVDLRVSLFARGAAHPNHWAHTFTSNGVSLQHLNDLSERPGALLVKVADYCQQALLKNPWANKKWIEEGAAAKAENYQNWVLTENGIRIIFDPYQVAPYVYGFQQIDIPASALSGVLKPAVYVSLWE